MARGRGPLGSRWEALDVVSSASLHRGPGSELGMLMPETEAPLVTVRCTTVTLRAGGAFLEKGSLWGWARSLLVTCGALIKVQSIFDG